MKKILIILILLTILGCNIKEDFVKPTLEIEQVEETKVIEEIYKDDNPIVLGLYDKDRKLIDSYSDKWLKKKDIVWLSIFPTNEGLSKENSKTLWKKYWDNNKDKGYKFGIEISYKTDEEVNLSILKFSDNTHFKYVEIYLYDGYNTNASWISHLEDKDFNDKTVFTSVKITAGESINEVKSPIILKVFTYDSEDDFDELGKYRGNSFYKVVINNKS